jgi:hypothetical protein
VDFIIGAARAEPFGVANAIGFHTASVSKLPMHNMSARQTACQSYGVGVPENTSETHHARTGEDFSTTDTDPEWIPDSNPRGQCGSEDGVPSWGFSTGKSDPDDLDTANVLLGELGQYREDGQIEAEEEFANRFSEANWHTKTWELLPRQPFSSPSPGPKKCFGTAVPKPI